MIVAFTMMSAFGINHKGFEMPIADQTCTLTVKYSSGSAAKSVTVKTDVSGDITCSGGRSFDTDSNGKVTLQWSSGCYLRRVYVKGKTHQVDYKNGGDYTLTID